MRERELIPFKVAKAKTGHRSTKGFRYFAARVGLTIYEFGDRIRRVDAVELDRILSAPALEPDAIRAKLRAAAQRRRIRPPQEESTPSPQK